VRGCQRIELLLSWLSASRSSDRLLAIISLSLLVFSNSSFAADSKPQAYRILEKRAKYEEAENTRNGWAYVISGTLALGVSIPGYYLSQDVFAQVIFSVGQNLGVASVGYGSYLLLVDQEYARFHRILKQAPQLGEQERESLAHQFLAENADRARNLRKIRVITHGLTAALNFVNGTTATNRELKTALYFLGGINTVAALAFGFGKSEEEEIKESLKAELIIGPMVGLRVTW
jgi:hypothetical protein